MARVSHPVRCLARRLQLAGLGLALLAFSPVCLADTVRVATWSFPAAATTSPDAEAGVEQAAAALKKLNPDVILLEQVRGWEMCGALAQALKPADYTVVVCSAFRGTAGGTAAPAQAAILSKHKGYFSWSEPWRVEGAPAAPGGFAFAAIQFGKHRVGFFSAHVDGQTALLNNSVAAGAALSRQWAQSVNAFKSWVTNRLEAVVVAGGDWPTGSKEADFTLRFLSAPLAQPVAVSAPSVQPEGSTTYLPVGLAADSATVPGVVLSGARAACELDLNAAKALAVLPPPPKVIPSSAAPPPAPAPATPKLVPALNPPPSTLNPSHPFLWGGVLALLALTWLWARRRRALSRARLARLPAAVQTGNGISSYTLVVTPQSITNSTFSPAAQSHRPHRVPRPGQGGSPPGQGEAWPPGPLVLEAEAPPEAALNRTGLFLHLSQWLKQKMVQRLIADRAQLLNTQQAATVKLLSFEDRLARIELQVQQQNRAYEQRIQELNEELLAAKDENRELIRARIAQLKAEMETARAKLLAQAGTAEQ